MTKWIPMLLCSLIGGACLMCYASETVEPVKAAELRDTWILDGEVDMAVLGDHEIRLDTPADKQFTLWTPRVYEGPVEVSFDAMVPEKGTKLLLMLYGHGLNDQPLWTWKREAAYDEYNSGPMEVYTLAFNRGAHTAVRSGDEFANIRRIGGPAFAFYGPENRAKADRAKLKKLWAKWNTVSFIGGMREPESGVGKFISYRILLDPPHIRMECNGVAFAEVVDHRANPLKKGAIGFRCMSKGKSVILRNIRIAGTVIKEKPE